MYAFVGVAPLMSRSAFAGSAVSKAPAPAAATVTMKASKAIPFLEAPQGLDESKAGYVGFDPLYLSNYLNQDYAAQGELKNGRVAMLACLGWLVAEFVHLPAKQFSNPVALDAIYQIPLVGWVQILTFISLVELATFKMMYDPSRRAGDLGFDPLKMDSPAMRLKEVKNGRLAMIGIIGLIFQQLVFHKPTISQLTQGVTL
ncbi:hypothetical protein BU14_0127s0012 [Porphyra umbilicalis]|uniref:Chlorophyll a-b binding protein, chloroplastic n=1 Tax=Porphyra umbilicalis TaxID=2786 RepID=A0A1X6PAM8_PORUM|nr:hypothetical protein BU14_0127s0012 [Porphyra umbilicalis]|eukprot:OSX77914.1 hypothetical protein BU14_0127s0012 [Porphyra umbilicalis]